MTLSTACAEAILRTRLGEPVKPPTDYELIRSRLQLQQGMCNLTGLTLHAHGPDADPNLLPSANRIDSSRHYEFDNVQIVCRFVNFWKGASNNAEFKRLMMPVRGVEVAE